MSIVLSIQIIFISLSTKQRIVRSQQQSTQNRSAFKPMIRTPAPQSHHLAIKNPRGNRHLDLHASRKDVHWKIPAAINNNLPKRGIIENVWSYNCMRWLRGKDSNLDSQGQNLLSYL